MTTGEVRVSGLGGKGTGSTGYRASQLLPARLVGQRLAPPATAWGLGIGLYVFASAAGYRSLAATSAQRQALLDSLAANTGLKALLGEPHRLDSVGPFVDWRTLGVLPVLISVWALLAATRWLRGEESAGRWELLLAGRTTARRATVATLAGLGYALALMCVLVTAATALAGATGVIAFSVGRSALFGATVVAAPALFLAVGALASQLMPTRHRAAALSASVLGICFLLRVIGDLEPAARWIRYLSPLSWIEQLRPLGSPDARWLLPVGGLTSALLAASIWLADRDIGSSRVRSADTGRCRTAMLGSPLRLAVRLTGAATASWLAAGLVVGLLYGSFAKSAGQTFASSPALAQFSGKLTGTAQQQGTRTYAGVVFLMLMTLTMAYVCSAMHNVREQEAEGYLDNLLVREVTRLRWLAGRGLIIAVVAVLINTLAAIGFWLPATAQGAGLDLDLLAPAAANASVPALLLLGIVLLGYGMLPRWAVTMAYSAVAWSFLVQLLGLAIRVNHWIMDTSLLHHLALAPAADPDWPAVGAYLGTGLLLAILGAWRFDRRDVVLA